MLRTVIAHGCLACSLAVAAATPALAQLAPQGHANEWHRLVVKLGQPTPDPAALDLVLKLRERSADALRVPVAGGTDYVAQLHFQRPLGAWGAFGHLGLRGALEGPGMRLTRDPWHGRLGGLRGFEGGHEAGAYVDYRPASAELDAVRELTAYAALRSGAWHYQLQVTRSLTPAFPALAAELSVQRRF